MKNLVRNIVAGLCLVAGVLIVSYMQNRFDQSDIQHAVDATRSARPNGAQESLEQLVARAYGISPSQIHWEPAIRSKWKGTVEVRATDPQGQGNLAWEVDVVRFSVTPLNPESQNLGKNKETP